MERPYTHMASSGKRSPYVVPAPGPADAMSGPLQKAFGRERGVTDDMSRLLALLNRVPD